MLAVANRFTGSLLMLCRLKLVSSANNFILAFGTACCLSFTYSVNGRLNNFTGMCWSLDNRDSERLVVTVTLV